MGYILLSSQKDSEGTPLENRKVVSDEDIDRIAYAWANIIYPQGFWEPEVPAVTDADGNVVTPAVPGYFRTPTGAEVHHALTERIYNDIKAQTEAFYLRQAEQQARASVNPISLTPVE